eukprot:UN26270
MIGGFWWLGFGLYSIANVHNRDIPNPSEAGPCQQICQSWSETYQMFLTLYASEKVG